MRALLVNALVDDRILSRTTPAAAASTEGVDPVFRVARPALLFFAFVDCLHKAYKSPAPKPSPSAAVPASPVIAAAPLPALAPVPSPAPAAGGGNVAPAAAAPVLSVNVAHKVDEVWISAMQAHLRSSDTKPIDLVVDILKNFEEALMPAESVQELFDELGFLKTALAEAPCADDFVKQIWAKCPNKDAAK